MFSPKTLNTSKNHSGFSRRSCVGLWIASEAGSLPLAACNRLWWCWTCTVNGTCVGEDHVLEKGLGSAFSTPCSLLSTAFTPGGGQAREAHFPPAGWGPLSKLGKAEGIWQFDHLTDLQTWHLFHAEVNWSIAEVDDCWAFYFGSISPPPPFTSFPSTPLSNVTELLLSRSKSHSFSEGECVLKYQIYQKTSATCKPIVLLLYEQAIVNSFKSVTYFTF